MSVLEDGVNSVSLDMTKRAGFAIEAVEAGAVTCPEGALPIFIDGVDHVCRVPPVVVELSGTGVEAVQSAAVRPKPHSSRAIDVDGANITLVESSNSTRSFPPRAEPQDLLREPADAPAFGTYPQVAFSIGS